jgi:hypothetical protein
MPTLLLLCAALAGPRPEVVLFAWGGDATGGALPVARPADAVAARDDAGAKSLGIDSPTGGAVISTPRPLPDAPGLSVWVLRVEARSDSGPSKVTARIVVQRGDGEAGTGDRPLFLDNSWRVYTCEWRLGRFRETPLGVELSFPESTRARIRGLSLTARALVSPPDQGPGGAISIRNSGFELGAAGWGALDGVGPGWRIAQRPGEGGRACLELRPDPAGPVLYRQFPSPHVELAGTAGAVTTDTFGLTPGGRYVVSFQAQAERDGTPVHVVVRQDTGRQAAAAVDVGTAWVPCEVRFTADGTCGALGFTLAEPSERGRPAPTPAPVPAAPAATVWVDDVSVRAEDASGPAPPRWDIELVPSAPSGCFRPGEAMALDVRALTHWHREKLSVSVSVLDVNGRERATASLDLPPGRGPFRRGRVPIDLAENGFFSAEVTARLGDDEVHRAVRLARFADYTADDSPFGVSWGWEEDGPFVLARRAGCAWVRDASGGWGVAEPTRGERSFLIAHAFADRYRRMRYHVMDVIPFPSAPWASGVDDPQVWKADGVAPFVGARAYLPSEGAPAFAAYVRDLLRDLGDRVEAVEVLEWPLVGGWALPPSRYTAQDYVGLVQDVRTAVRDAGWQGTIVGGPGTLPGPGPRDLHGDLVAAGLQRSVDAWGFRAPPDGIAPEWLRDRVVGLRHTTGEAPVWATDIPAPGDDTPSPVALASSRGLPPSELDAAEVMVRTSVALLANGVQRVFFSASSHSPHGPGAGWDWLVTPAGEPRKALPVLAALAGRLGPSPRPAGVLSLASATAYVFDTQTGACAVICPLYGESCSLRPERPAEGLAFYDLCGNGVPTPPGGDLPFYAAAPGAAADLMASLRGCLG